MLSTFCAAAGHHHSCHQHQHKVPEQGLHGVGSLLRAAVVHVGEQRQTSASRKHTPLSGRADSGVKRGIRSIFVTQKWECGAPVCALPTTDGQDVFWNSKDCFGISFKLQNSFSSQRNADWASLDGQGREASERLLHAPFRSRASNTLSSSRVSRCGCVMVVLNCK